MKGQVKAAIPAAARGARVAVGMVQFGEEKFVEQVVEHRRAEPVNEFETVAVRI